MTEIGTPRPAETGPGWSGDQPAPPGRNGQRRPAVTALQLLVVALVAALVAAGVTFGLVEGAGIGKSTTSGSSTTSTIANQPADTQTILAEVLPSVVAITATVVQATPTAPSGKVTVTSLGTGVVVTRGGEIVTNDHVVGGATDIRVTLSGSRTPTPASVIGSSPSHDLALLQLKGRADLKPATFARSSEVKVGDEVLAVGFALGLAGGPSVTDGIISATGRRVATEGANGSRVTLTGMLQTDAAISSGNSGGPLVDAKGQVVGINTAVATSNGTTTAQNIGFAIPSDTVQALLPTLRG